MIEKVGVAKRENAGAQRCVGRRAACAYVTCASSAREDLKVFKSLRESDIRGDSEANLPKRIRRNLGRNA